MHYSERIELYKRYTDYYFSWYSDDKYEEYRKVLSKPMSFERWVFYEVVTMHEWVRLIHHKDIWYKKYLMVTDISDK